MSGEKDNAISPSSICADLMLGGSTEDRELSPTVEVFDIGFRAVTANGKLPTRWGALKIERQN